MLLAPINRRYGTHRGLVRLLLSYAEVHAGDLRAIRSPTLQGVRRLVFVCQGNICRSCYGEAYARSLGLDASSCGLAIAGPVPAYGLAIETAARHGIDLMSHRARAVQQFEWAQGDLLLAMEPRQMRRLRNVAVPAFVQQSLLGLWASPNRPHIHDPHLLSADYFNTCFKVISGAIDHLSEELHTESR